MGGENCTPNYSWFGGGGDFDVYTGIKPMCYKWSNMEFGAF